MNTAQEMHKDAVCVELRGLLNKFTTYQNHEGALTSAEHVEMERTRRKIEDLTSILEMYDRQR